MANYLEVAEVIEIHRRVVERTGGIYQGFRSLDLLESALARPMMAAQYEDADLVRQSALIAIGISQNQPFVDGNKRAAFAAAVSFLDLNGILYDGDPFDYAKQLEAVAERADSLDAATDRFEAWLRANTVAQMPPP